MFVASLKNKELKIFQVNQGEYHDSRSWVLLHNLRLLNNCSAVHHIIKVKNSNTLFYLVTNIRTYLFSFTHRSIKIISATRPQITTIASGTYLQSWTQIQKGIILCLYKNGVLIVENILKRESKVISVEIGFKPWYFDEMGEPQNGKIRLKIFGKSSESIICVFDFVNHTLDV